MIQSAASQPTMRSRFALRVGIVGDGRKNMGGRKAAHVHNQILRRAKGLAVHTLRRRRATSSPAAPNMAAAPGAGTTPAPMETPASLS